MEIEALRHLLYKRAKGTLNEAERQQLNELLSNRDDDRIVQALEQLIAENEMPTAEGLAADVRQTIFESVVASDKTDREEKTALPVHRVHFLRTAWFRYAAAAVIIITGAALYYFTGLPSSSGKSVPGVVQATDIPPGQDGAILTLADGSRLLLDSAGNGLIATQNGAQVILKDGYLVYNPVENAGDIAYNTMNTPKGRQFQLALPDGTRVWLNAASSIRYPTVFYGKERRVEITGEAYFEVAKNAALPFRVKINDATEVEVLGTRFNINAYENEDAIKTTLVEGSVRINAFAHSQTLRPGQQAVINQKTAITASVNVENADIGKALAWKNGLFSFDGLRLSDAMKQLERWYDIEVVFQDKVPDIGLYGELDRNVSLTSIISVLERPEIHFRIEGRKLIVSR